MKQKLLKLSFQSKEDWETTKKTLLDEEGNFVKGVKEAIELKQMQCPPPADWTPDPNNPDDNGWTTYPDYAVDLIVEADYDFGDLAQHLILEPASGRFGHKIAEGEYEIIYKRT